MFTEVMWWKWRVSDQLCDTKPSNSYIEPGCDVTDLHYTTKQRLTKNQTVLQQAAIQYAAHSLFRRLLALGSVFRVQRILGAFSITSTSEWPYTAATANARGRTEVESRLLVSASCELCNRICAAVESPRSTAEVTCICFAKKRFTGNKVSLQKKCCYQHRCSKISFLLY